MNEPRLRFKGFRDEWQNKKLKNIGKIVTGNTPKTSDLDNYDNVNGLSWITPTDISNGTVYNTRIKLSKNGIKKSRIVPANSILITCIGNSIGSKTLSVSKTAFNQQINALIPNNNDSYFLFSRFSLINKIIKLYSSNGTMPIINKSEFSNIIFNVPCINEQQKIGSFFEKLDRLIQLQSDKLEHLKLTKKGYLQKMFINRFDKKLRFKNFKSNWKMKKLTELVSIRTGNKNVEDNNENGKYIFFDRSVNIKHLNSYDYQGKTIIYAGEDSKEIPFMPRYYDGKYSLHQRTYGLYGFKNVNPIYLYYFLMTVNKIFIRFSVGTTAQSLRRDTFKHVKVPITIMEEQDKLVLLFSNIDQQITLQQQKLDNLKQQKKAYLQKMFI